MIGSTSIKFFFCIDWLWRIYWNRTRFVTKYFKNLYRNKIYLLRFSRNFEGGLLREMTNYDIYTPPRAISPCGMSHWKIHYNLWAIAKLQHLFNIYHRSFVSASFFHKYIFVPIHHTYVQHFIDLLPTIETTSRM